jgi:glycosyltransferase involved in cell wall biosynthesis
MICKSSSNILFSTVIATIGRPTLARAVESILSQDSPVNFEVIVVNDSGHSLSVEDWHRSEQVTILNTNRRERCVARNAGAAIARGTYLHFLDDDDWMLPGALKELWAVARTSNASLIYGTSRMVDKDGKLLAEHHIGVDGNAFVQVMAGELIPIQSSLIESACFFEVGGFDPRLVGAEDWDICRRVALRIDVVSTRFPVACIVLDRKNSTTNYGYSTALSIWSRDNILDEKGSFTRMWASARTPYWRGRLVRTYLTCIAWNLSKRKILKALSRTSEAAAGFILSATNMTSLAFWHALFRYHHSKVNG